MQQIIDNLKTLRNGLFKDEQAVIELIDETLKLVEQKASQFDAFVIPKITDLDKLPLWTEIYIQPLDINKKEETKVYWLKHPQIKPKTFYDKNITNLINEFLEFWENR